METGGFEIKPDCIANLYLIDEESRHRSYFVLALWSDLAFCVLGCLEKHQSYIYMGWGQVCFVYLLVWTDHVCGCSLTQHILNSQQFGSPSRVCMEGEAREAPI